MSAEELFLAGLNALPPAEAAALIVDRWESGEVSNAFVDLWLAASAENRAGWSRARDGWDALTGLEDAPELASLRAAALAARRERPVWMPYAMAASVAVAISAAALIGFGSHYSGTDGGEHTPVIAAVDLHRFGSPDYVAQDRPVDVTLPDGTRVQLAPGSALDFADAGGLRLARLERGQATFDVRHDKTRAFRLAVGGRVITDMGTFFSVDLTRGVVRMKLVRGSVSVSHGGDPTTPPAADAVTLQPGDNLVASGNADKVTHATVPPAGPDTVVFDKEPLAHAIERMNRRSGVQLVVTDRQVAQLRISGSFRASDTERFARALTVLYPLTTKQMPDGRIMIAFAARRHRD